MRRRLNVRQKILNIRLRKFENGLTVPNITRELFRGSQLELIMPPVAEYLATKLSGKSIYGIIAGLIASLGSIKFFARRKKSKAVKKERQKKVIDKEEDQLFI